MSNEIVKLYQENPIRIIERNGEPWFVAKDVCKVLELDMASGARGLDPDEKGLHIMQTRGGEQKIQIVSEAGLYSIILRSRKPEAKAFKRWITHEILPSIRRNGAYVHEAAKYEDVLRAVLEAQDRHVGQVIQQNVELKAEVRYLKLFEPHGEPGDVSDITGLPKINW